MVSRTIYVVEFTTGSARDLSPKQIATPFAIARKKRSVILLNKFIFNFCPQGSRTETQESEGPEKPRSRSVSEDLEVVLIQRSVII